VGRYGKPSYVAAYSITVTFGIPSTRTNVHFGCCWTVTRLRSLFAFTLIFCYGPLPLLVWAVVLTFVRCCYRCYGSPICAAAAWILCPLHYGRDFPLPAFYLLVLVPLVPRMAPPLVFEPVDTARYC